MGCWEERAVCQKPMPDARYTPAFWTSVAKRFKGDDAVLFDLPPDPTIGLSSSGAAGPRRTAEAR